jgi:hypothetical protein
MGDVNGGQIFILDKSPPHERTQASPPQTWRKEGRKEGRP